MVKTLSKYVGIFLLLSTSALADMPTIDMTNIAQTTKTAIESAKTAVNTNELIIQAKAANDLATDTRDAIGKVGSIGLTVQSWLTDGDKLLSCLKPDLPNLIPNFNGDITNICNAHQYILKNLYLYEKNNSTEISSIGATATTKNTKANEVKTARELIYQDSIDKGLATSLALRDTSDKVADEAKAIIKDTDSAKNLLEINIQTNRALAAILRELSNIRMLLAVQAQIESSKELQTQPLSYDSVKRNIDE
ncbi:MAG: hypothetical protein AB7V00_05260 [Bacilli bacterium]